MLKGLRRSAIIAALLAATNLHADGPMGVSSPESSLFKAEQAIQAKSWRVAAGHLRLALREEPKNPDVHNWLGYVARQQGKLDEAFRHYEDALRLDPNHRGAHEYVGEAYVLAGKPEQARQHLEKLEAICGKNCEQYRDLAAAIARGGK